MTPVYEKNKLESKKRSAEKEIIIERARFVLPPDKGQDFHKLRNRMYEFEETKFVDDYIEQKNLIRELELLDPLKIRT